MQFSEIIYDIQNSRNGGLQTDDNPLSDRQVAYLINMQRALIIRSENEKNKFISPDLVQRLNDIEVSIQDSSVFECGDDVCILKTNKKLPKPISTNRSLLFTYVGNNAFKNFQYTNINRLQYDLKTRYTSNLTRWFYLDRHIYIVAPKNISMDYISVHGVFSDPYEANKFAKCDCKDTSRCDLSYNFDYPIKDDMIPNLKMMLLKLDIASIRQQLDVTNNTNANE